MEWLVILKIIFLFLGVWWTFVTVTLIINKEDIPWGNFLLSSLGVVGFAVLQFGLYI